MYTTETQVEGFVSEYMRSKVVTETSIRAMIKRVVEWENIFNKNMYEFNKDEALKMFSSVHAISVISLQNINLVMKHFARWLIDNKNLSITSTFEDIGKYDLEQCIDQNKKQNLIITRDELDEIMDQLLNATDKAILLLLFKGAGGERLQEIMFATIDQLSKTDMKMYFKNGKTIELEQDEYDIIHEGFIEDELASFGTSMRVSKVVPLGLYKMRCNALSYNDNINNEGDRERRYRYAQRRLMLISDAIGMNITSNSVQESGLLHRLQLGVEESGLEFREYIKTPMAKKWARQYGLMSDLYQQILVEKFNKYF